MATLKLVRIDNGKNRIPTYQVVIAETNEPITGVSNLSINCCDSLHGSLHLSTIDFQLESRTEEYKKEESKKNFREFL